MPGEQRSNEHGQPIGFPIEAWGPRQRPPRTSMQGRFARVVPLETAYTEDLFEANFATPDPRDWTYLPYGPFAAIEEYRVWVEWAAASRDPLFHAVIDAGSVRPAGVASYSRIDPANGVIEVGHIKYGSALKRTPAGTEAMYLLMRRVFDELGYRRYEWKCDALNTRSRTAAERFGFSFEGIFRQAVVVKGRNRDTAWYSIIDREWPVIKAGFEQWLAPDNFDSCLRQKRRLAELIAACRSDLR